MKLKIGDLIEENNNLVKEIDGMDCENDITFYSKLSRYKELQNMIKLNTRAEKQKEVSEIRYSITKNKEEILETFNNRCEVCNFNFKEVLVVHHILPISDGGTNELENLSVLCPTCHAIVHKLMSNNKQNKGWDEFEMFTNWAEENIPQTKISKLISLSYGQRGLK